MPPVASHPDRSFPLLHSRPAKGWLNDPNGIHHSDGSWHVFFQYNPDSARHGDITWGHMTSTDLLRWEQEGIALRPQPGAGDEHGCWSGIATIDDGVPTLVYSGVRDLWGHSDVMLARPSSDGEGWVQSDHVAAPMPENRRVLAVRDPFLFEFEGRRWGLLGASHAPGIGAILLYDASDLAHWEERGVFAHAMTPEGKRLRPANMWECPQLVRVGDDWVLLFSLWVGGHTDRVCYLIGSLALDEATGLPRFSPRAGGLLDDGVSFYAPQAVQDGGAADGADRVLLWGWAREVAPDGVRGRSEEEADEVGWSGILTFPRELAVDGDAVYAAPARELIALRGASLRDLATLGGLSVSLPDQAELLLGGTGPVELLLGPEDEPGQLLYRAELAGGGVRILIDASLVEVFPEGATPTTLRAYPSDGETYRLIAGPEIVVEGWELRLPE
ncbi:MAG: glycoside hydrolase family 32 protein [Tessaracoccus sp.]|uniref:glycoside hydrolase family 32 protein n=1 Tax=Tessaracoccus sp. TaxID=1971211 RepID=UPI001EB6A523|nr:glycoside hydrolase family 32 protein [Tessaracoccus sp.]MBK7820722.1 glycoside hydrolase family 32 protein [Tessaracoccus sp.]